MKIEKTFDLDYPREIVWREMNDAYVVASCLPGASIIEQLGDNRYRGRMSVKVGPMAAAFDGEVDIDGKPQDWTAIVSGKGADTRSSSRASGSMTYRLDEIAPARTRVAAVSEINLAGPLAQFGKGAIVQEIASRITADFVRNFEAHLSSAPLVAGAPVGVRPAKPQSFDAGNLLWSMLRARIRSFFERILGRLVKS